MDPDPYLVLMDPDRDPGGPKTYRTDLGSATLLFYGDSGFSGPDPKTDVSNLDPDPQIVFSRTYIRVYCWMTRQVSPADALQRLSGFLGQDPTWIRTQK